jgi:hypothetical protein
MIADPDDEALRWGDDDPSHVAGPSAPRRAEAPVPAAATSTGSAALVGYGIMAGIFLLYSIGWFIAVQRDTFTQPSLFAEIMYQLGEFFAIASPIIWLGAVFLLTSGDAPARRLIWLGAGVLLLAPWPFILGGSA